MRQLSSDMLQALFAGETGEAVLGLVTIEEESLSDPIRVTSNGVDTESNGNTFIPCPFRYSFPDQSDEGEIQAKLEIDNVDRRITKAVRNASGIPTVTTQLVMASTPDTIEAEFPDFELTNVGYDKLVVEGTLTVESLTSLPFPAHTFDPQKFPNLF